MLRSHSHIVEFAVRQEEERKALGRSPSAVTGTWLPLGSLPCSPQTPVRAASGV